MPKLLRMPFLCCAGSYVLLKLLAHNVRSETECQCGESSKDNDVFPSGYVEETSEGGETIALQHQLAFQISRAGKRIPTIPRSSNSANQEMKSIKNISYSPKISSG